MIIVVCSDQPNRRIRTRMYGGVGGAPHEGRPYPYRRNPLVKLILVNLPILHNKIEVFDRLGD